jgi:hypothetical protein
MAMNADRRRNQAVSLQQGAAMTVRATNTSEMMDYPLPRQCQYQPSALTARLREPGPITTVRLYDGRTAWLVTGPDEARSLPSDRRTSDRTMAQPPPGRATYLRVMERKRA